MSTIKNLSAVLMLLMWFTLRADIQESAHQSVIFDYTDVPVDVRKELDKKPQEIQAIMEQFESVTERSSGEDFARCHESWLPGYCIKYGVERVANAKRLREFIESNELNMVGVPKKYLYHIPTKPFDLDNDNYAVIAEKIEGNPTDDAVTLRDIQRSQMVKVIQELPYIDFGATNILLGKDEKLTIIDTDAFAMPLTPALMNEHSRVLIVKALSSFDERARALSALSTFPQDETPEQHFAKVSALGLESLKKAQEHEFKACQRNVTTEDKECIKAKAEALASLMACREIKIMANIMRFTGQQSEIKKRNGHLVHNLCIETNKLNSLTEKLETMKA